MPLESRVDVGEVVLLGCIARKGDTWHLVGRHLSSDRMLRRRSETGRRPSHQLLHRILQGRRGWG